MSALRILAAVAVVTASAQLLGCAEKPAKAPAQSRLPTVAFLAPTAGSHLHGVVTITATATGAGKITALAFTAPAALAGATATLDATTGGATLAADLDLSPFPDGPLTITATASDEFGAAASKDLVLHVAKRAPDLTVARPASSSTVRGVVTIEATAAAHAEATIASLDLVDPPAGCGTTVRGEGILTVTWDTTRAPEGPASLHLRAIDSLGLVSDATVLVTVDNVALGRIEALVSAGAPIQGALVDVFALDDATALVSTAAGAGGLLGAGGPTDASGRAVVTLSVENYAGPVAVVARPAPGATLAYVDPVPPGRTVAIPAGLSLSSTLARYVTGASVTVPVTLWTTLADAELAAYAGGAHRLFPTRHSVVEAAAFGDRLFSAHFQAGTPRWDLRATVPALLTEGPARALDDRSYAALPDVTLAQLARAFGAAANVTDVITAPYLVQLLREDLAADGQLDGKGADSTPLRTAGAPPVALDEDTLRVELAGALNDFVLGSHNLSGLDRATLEAAYVYSTISGDVSPLFGAKAPSGFDTAPPSVTVTVTHGPTAAAPVGASNLVHGVVRVEVAATDLSGVKTITVAADGTDLPGTLTAGANGAATFVATYDSTRHAEGLLGFSISATDGRSNARVASYQVTVDNKGPALTIDSPLASTWYAGAILLEATATDENGVASCEETTRGLATTVSPPSTDHYRASFTPGAGTADGALALSFRACDVVGNCSVLPATAAWDTKAPFVSVATPPAYTTAPTITLTATVTDAGAGVAAVFATSGSHPAVPGTLSGNTWTFSGVPLDEGPNPIVVSATDRASPANGTLPTAPGCAVSVFRDSLPPAPSIVADAATYVDERGIALANASVPPTYVLASSAKVAPVTAGVHKVATRLAWTTTPTPALLEGANPENIPFVRISVPTGGTNSDVVTAQYTITVPGAAPVTGDLAPWKSPASTGATSLYDLPLAANLAPALATLTSSPATVTVSAKFWDSAGNAGERSADVSFDVLGPPLLVTEDSAYAGLGDRASSHFYMLASGNYHELWNATNAALVNGGVRLVRLVVSNPASAPVGLAVAYAQAPTASWHMDERWDRDVAVRLDPSITLAQCNGFVPEKTNTFSHITVDGRSVSGCDEVTTDPFNHLFNTCFLPDMTTGVLTHVIGAAWSRNASADLTYGTFETYYEACQPPGRYPATGTAKTTSSSVADVQAFAGPLAAGGETAPPATVGPGTVIVPAASGGVPGTVVVYVVRPVSAVEQSALAWDAAASAYRTAVELFLTANGNSGKAPGYGYTEYTYTDFWVMKGLEKLAAAQETLNGVVTLSTQGVSQNAVTPVLVGAAAAQPSITFTNRVVATH